MIIVQPFQRPAQDAQPLVRRQLWRREVCEQILEEIERLPPMSGVDHDRHPAVGRQHIPQRLQPRLR